MSHPGWWDVTGGKLTTYRLMAEETVDSIVKHLGVKTPPCQTATTPLADGGRGDWLSGILPPPVSLAAVAYYCHEESARHVDDVMIRRTSWRHYHHNHLELAKNVAAWMATELSWNDSQLAAELERYRRLTGAVEPPAPHILVGRGQANGNGLAAAANHQTSSESVAVKEH
jgi:glycerol-3-phosphate dehydrogenase